MGNKKRIILAEDDGALRNMFQKMLEGTYELSLQRNGKGVIEAVDAGLPDLILLDVRMPEMDGIQVLEILNQRGLVSSMPIVMLSNLEDNEQVDRAMSLGAVGYLKKSELDFEDIQRRIAGYLG